MQSVWSHIRKISGKCTPSPSPILHLQGDSVADSTLVADALGNYFSDVSRGIHLPSDFHSLKSTTENIPITCQLSMAGSHNVPFALPELTFGL